MMDSIYRLFSHILPICIHRYTSAHSGELDIRWEKGRLALNAPGVNYSYNRLHHIMRNALTNNHLRLHSGNKILNLGMGAGSTVSILREELKLDNPITSVEIDPLIIEIAQEHFDIDRFKNHRIINEDAASYVRQSNEQFDLIIVDLFIDAVVPEKFRQAAFIHDLENVLSTDGQILFNHMKAMSGQGYSPALNRLSGEVQRLSKQSSENDVLLYSRR